MKGSKPWLSGIITIILSCFIMFDLVFSAMRYHQLPIDGDFSRIAVPLNYDYVLKDPIGIQAIIKDTSYAGAGRFTCHAAVRFWSKNIFQVVSKLSPDPIESVFLMSALFSILIHILFIWLAFKYISIRIKLTINQKLLVIAMSTSYIQMAYLYYSIGVVDQSLTYTFFYAFPLLVLTWNLFPFYRAYQTGFLQLTIVEWCIMPIVSFALAFSSPLIQPIVILIGLGLGLLTFYFKHPSITKIVSSKEFKIQFGFLFLACAYAFLVSRHNSENGMPMPISMRYIQLAKGIFFLFTKNSAVLSLLILVVINMLILQKQNNLIYHNLFKLLQLLFVASCIYTLLLPLGGYRSYRPYVVRYDTFMPVTFLLMFYVLLSTILVWTEITRQGTRWKYGVLITSFILLFTWLDIPSKFQSNACQRIVMRELYASKDSIVYVSKKCNLLTWDVADLSNQDFQWMLTKQFQEWGIIQPYQQIK
jgi:hypothetical protein